MQERLPAFAVYIHTSVTSAPIHKAFPAIVKACLALHLLPFCSRLRYAPVDTAAFSHALIHLLEESRIAKCESTASWQAPRKIAKGTAVTNFSPWQKIQYGPHTASWRKPIEQYGLIADHCKTVETASMALACPQTYPLRLSFGSEHLT